VRAIAGVDADVLGPILRSPARPAALVLPDHYTPLSTRTHSGPPVPFVLSEPPAGVGGRGASAFGEAQAAATGLYVESGPELMTLFLESTGQTVG